MSSKVKTALIVIIITVIVLAVFFIVHCVRNEMIVYDKDGMMYEAENTSDCSQGDE